MGETSNRGIATGKWTTCSGMSTLDFWDRNRKIDEDESCSRDCALSKKVYVSLVGSTGKCIYNVLKVVVGT